MTSEQLAAINAVENRIVVVACAGSGKTRCLIARIERLVRSGSDPAGLVAITFTNNAGNVMSERLSKLNPPVAIQFCGTLHSYVLRLLREYGRAIGLPRRLAVIDEETADEIMTECAKELGYRGSAKALEAAAASVPFFDTQDRVGAEQVAAAFHLRLVQGGLLTYDSILSYGLHLLESKRREGGFGEGRYDELLFDEAQDISEQDWRIIQTLPFARRFMVGDFRQRIFSFRGSSDKFEKLCR